MRLQKYIAHAGICSRRAAEGLILQGRVRVNGKIVNRMGVEIDPGKDRVEVDGKEIRRTAGHHYLMLYKPRGVVTTVKDPFHRSTVLDLIQDPPSRLYPVGRLDLDSEGLLLLTDDGELANRLIHPRYKVEKRYIVEVSGHPTKAEIAKIAGGIELDGKRTMPCTIRPRARGRRWTSYEVILKEGKKRQIRRMFQAIGHGVRRLVRVGIGPLTLRGLSPGRWRPLTAKELEQIRGAVGLTGAVETDDS